MSTGFGFVAVTKILAVQSHLEAIHEVVVILCQAHMYVI
jgi:hypothetical protein